MTSCSRHSFPHGRAGSSGPGRNARTAPDISCAIFTRRTMMLIMAMMMIMITNGGLHTSHETASSAQCWTSSVSKQRLE